MTFLSFLIQHSTFLPELKLFTKISLKQDIHEASETILLDKKHLDNNPQKVTGKDVEKLLNIINEGF